MGVSIFDGGPSNLWLKRMAFLIVFAFASASHAQSRPAKPGARREPVADVRVPTLAVRPRLRSRYFPGEQVDALIQCLREPWRKTGSVPHRHYVSSCKAALHDPSGRVLTETLAEPPEGPIPFMGVHIQYIIRKDAPPGIYRIDGEMHGPGIPGTGRGRWTFHVTPRRGAGSPHPARNRSSGAPAESPE